MKKRTVRIIFAVLLLVVLTACSSQPATPAEPAVSEPAADPSDTPQPNVESTVGPTDTPEPTSTALPTATLAPTATPTESPTPEIIYNIPGFYPFGGCVTYKVPAINAQIEWCVLNIEIRLDGTMTYAVSWTPKFGGGGTITKFSDAQNPRMNIIDNLGNKYKAVGVWGRARGESQVGSGQTIKGFFRFPKALPGATSFTFHDDDNDVSIGTFTFDVAPIILKELLELNWYQASVEYEVELWEVIDGEQGGQQLINLNIENCSLTEWETSDIEGKYKNVIDLGDITYEIYGWNDTDWSVREYLAVSGVIGGDPEVTPLFHATIPYEDGLQCIFDVSAVLGTFRIVDTNQ